jgi:alkylresorcinol/alkylpyrone synthase
MPRIAAIGTALPEHVITQRDAKSLASAMFAESYGGDIERLAGIYDNGEIERRQFCVPKEWFEQEHSFGEKNDLYVEHGLALSEQAIATCLADAGMSHSDIDYLMFVSTTGIATPSMDARLIERLPFRRNIKRLPIWGLGCAGGAAALSRAMEIARAVPTARVLTVVVELCGLTFMRNDMTKSALIATSLFADAAAAVIVAGDDADAPNVAHYPALVDSYTNTMPDSLDVMGWDIDGAGFRVVISRDIPAIVRTFMRETIETFLAERSMGAEDIEHYVAHPGGAKVLTAYEESLGLGPDQLRHTRSVLRTCGNVSACSVLFVLECFAREIAGRTLEAPEHGLLCALGPGFSAEVVLLRWEPRRD